MRVVQRARGVLAAACIGLAVALGFATYALWCLAELLTDSAPPPLSTILSTVPGRNPS